MKRLLPKNLTSHQVVAWVRYRTVDAVQRAVDPYALASMKFWNEPTTHGHIDELKLLLLEGKLSATGWKTHLDFEEIDPKSWETLPLAPLEAWRQHPYISVTVDRDVLLRLFPDLRERRRAGRKPKYDWVWIEEAARKEPSMGITKLADVLAAFYATEFGKRPSRRQILSYLDKWGYG